MTTLSPNPTAPAVTSPTSVTSTPAGTSALAHDTWLVMTRELRPLVRDPFSMIIAMVQPLVFLGLFAPLLPDTGAGSALQWFVPGIIAMSCLMGASMTGAALMEEMITGSHERLLVSPLSRTALMLGRSLKEIVPVLIQALLIVALVTPFSFDLHPLGVAAGLPMLMLFAIGVGSLSFALALAAKQAQWLFWTIQQTVLFPVLLLAGMLLPIGPDAPGWLRFGSELNPLRHIVDAQRALFAGQWPGGTVLGGYLAAALVAAIGLAVGLRAMRKAD